MTWYTKIANYYESYIWKRRIKPSAKRDERVCLLCNPPVTFISTYYYMKHLQKYHMKKPEKQ